MQFMCKPKVNGKWLVIPYEMATEYLIRVSVDSLYPIVPIAKKRFNDKWDFRHHFRSLFSQG